MKPQCPRPECKGGHTTGAHELLGEIDAGINLVTGEDSDSDNDEEWCVNTVKVGEEGENLEELENLELGESEEEPDNHCISACMRKDDSGLEDELEYFWDAPIPSDSDEREEDRWWSPGPQEPSSENEEEFPYLVSLLASKPNEGGNEEGAAPPQGGADASPSGLHRQASVKELVGEKERSPRPPRSGDSPAMKKPRRRKLRKRGTTSGDEKWEAARHAWLRELLTDSSGGESGDKYSRFAESGWWIAEMTGSRDRELREQEGNKEPET
jgi:hypothetical protein